jgi:hypothetical protein
VQGRRFEITYLQYFTEDYGRLSTLFRTAETARPTDIALGFGAWLKWKDADCGSVQNQGPCPFIPWVCRIFKEKHPYRLWWLGVLPERVNGQVTQTIPYDHPLHIPRVCELRGSQVGDIIYDTNA